jgi:hypothetical protein
MLSQFRKHLFREDYKKLQNKFQDGSTRPHPRTGLPTQLDHYLISQQLEAPEDGSTKPRPKPRPRPGLPTQRDHYLISQQLEAPEDGSTKPRPKPRPRPGLPTYHLSTKKQMEHMDGSIDPPPSPIPRPGLLIQHEHRICKKHLEQ